MDKNYIERLEQALSEFLRPLRNIPFAIVIKTITNKQVIQFNISDSESECLKNKLILAAQEAGKAAFEQGIYTKRPNEAGNANDVYHLLISFGMQTEIKQNRQCFLPVKWALFDLFNLSVQVKHEFNASNKEIYKKLIPLASGNIE